MGFGLMGCGGLAVNDGHWPTSPSSGQAAISSQLRDHKLPACHSEAAFGFAALIF
jgi:hypothetical protein